MTDTNLFFSCQKPGHRVRDCPGKLSSQGAEDEGDITQNAQEVADRDQAESDVIRFINSFTDAAGKPLIQDKRETGLVDFVVTLTATQRITESLLRNGYKLLLTYCLRIWKLFSVASQEKRSDEFVMGPHVTRILQTHKTSNVAAVKSVNCNVRKNSHEKGDLH
ncbi:hypothetical protein ElyMa_006971300 [Elysia marginata]|uniref:CCHC-type domain-containing protein n=1 Tax=Elysia marginata TaxID=1093978 RepID=A0AAV4JPB0_9GAST|nr:hypothetical protein ElyMa_006971300 [Elysia marginata]